MTKRLATGHLQDDGFLLLKPEFISVFLSHLNLVFPVRFEQQKPLFAQESYTLKDSGNSSSEMTPSCKWPIAVYFTREIA